ncbi:uncharacterized protein LOC144175401 [Haemaphysalis longicornis]
MELRMTTTVYSAIKGNPAQGTVTGHGGTTNMRTAAYPFLFIVQVRKHYEKCFCSSDPFVVVLPCPRLFCSEICCLLYDVASLCRKILLLGGDIETNPGPDLAKIAKKLNEIANDIKEIKEKRLGDIERKLDALTVLETNVSSCQEQIASLSTTIQTLENKLDDLENRSRRSNLIIYGLPEAEDESSDTLEHAVNQKIVKGILDLDPVGIERIHRLGRPSSGKVRPVIFKLLDSRDKVSILKKGIKLKGTNYSIGEDFSKRLRELRRKLWQSSKENRDNGDKTSLIFDKLYINKKAYVWNDEKNDKVPVQKKRNRRVKPPKYAKLRGSTSAPNKLLFLQDSSDVFGYVTPSGDAGYDLLKPSGQSI